MSNRFNFTGRKKIMRTDVAIELFQKIGEPNAVALSVKLAGYEFPPNANIVLEAHQRPNSMRFELGTVAAPAIPDWLGLLDLDPGSVPLFRLKVVDGDNNSRRILGAASNMRPDSDDKGDRRRSLLPIDSVVLHELVWNLKLTDAGPRLELNVHIDGLKDRIKRDPLLQGVLMPIVLQRILEKLADNDDEAEDQELDWVRDWKLFCADEFNESVRRRGREDDEELEWIGECLRKFCRSHDFVGRILKTKNEVPA